MTTKDSISKYYNVSFIHFNINLYILHIHTPICDISDKIYNFHPKLDYIQMYIYIYSLFITNFLLTN